MKRFMKMNTKRFAVLFLAMVLLAVVGSALAQASSHSVTITWTTQDTGVMFNVYKAPGACPASLPTAFPGTPAPFVKVASAVQLLTYTDTAVTFGTYCYDVTETFGAMEGGASNLAPATINLGRVTIVVTSAN